MSKAPWTVDVKGTAERSCEISVIREDFEHGFRSYGWFDPDRKIPVLSDGGPLSLSFPEAIFQAALQAALEYAEQLNSAEGQS